MPYEESGLPHDLEPRYKELSVLYEISRLLDASLDLREIIHPLLELLAKHMNMQFGMLTLCDKEAQHIRIEAAYGLSPKQQQVTYRFGEGITGKVVESGQSKIVPDTGKCPDFLNKTKAVDKLETSFVCVPIKLANEVVGTISAHTPIKSLQDLESDVRFLEIVAKMIAQAVRLRREALEQSRRIEEENLRLRAELGQFYRPDNIVGNSQEMQAVFGKVYQVAKTSTTVILYGETGTGKELIAKLIHYSSDRCNGPFIKVNCAALPENLIESELFGHEKGAFTGAITQRQGRFELANQGTIFLDEIGEIPIPIQVKLLRVLQEKEFERVGGSETIRVNVRVIAATNKNLEKKVQEGSFREDLFYRLHVFPIYLPPLRARKSDILPLADYFIKKFSNQLGKNIKRIASSAIDMLMAYHWPGNVRELENVIEHAIVVCDGEVIYPHHFPPTLQTADVTNTAPRGKMKRLIEQYEIDFIQDALKSSKGNITLAAEMLEITPRILAYKIKKYRIDVHKYKE